RHFLAQGYHHLGKVLGDLSQPGPCAEAYQQALALRERLVRDSPDVIKYRYALVWNYFNLGLLCGNGRFADAPAAFRKAVPHLEKLALDQPANPLFRYELALVCTNLGQLYQNEKRFAQAADAHRRALELRRRLAAGSPQLADLRSVLACSLNDLAI